MHHAPKERARAWDAMRLKVPAEEGEGRDEGDEGEGCGSDMDQIWIRYGSDMDQIWIRLASDMHPIWINSVHYATQRRHIIRVDLIGLISVPTWLHMSVIFGDALPCLAMQSPRTMQEGSLSHA